MAKRTKPQYLQIGTLPVSVAVPVQRLNWAVWHLDNHKSDAIVDVAPDRQSAVRKREVYEAFNVGSGRFVVKPLH
jgi:hypothetical protein